jgi:hypothetical protein
MAAGLLQTEILDVLSGSLAHFLRENPREVAWTHGCSSSKCGDLKIAPEIVDFAENPIPGKDEDQGPVLTEELAWLRRDGLPAPAVDT